MYNPDYMHGLAIFLENTETHYTIFNCAGEVKEQEKAPSVLIENGRDALIKLIEKIIAAHSSKINSIAIGVPGAVANGHIIYIPGYEQFQDIQLKEYVEDYFSIPVVIENDMNAAVFGFHHHRGFEENQSLVYLYFGHNGPGAGFMINGDVVRGSTFFAGEVQFVPQYNGQNFGQALHENKIDAINRLVASFAAILNPHTIIFNSDEVEEKELNEITRGSSAYISSKHLPKLVASDWKQDYMYGLQRLCLYLMMSQ